LEALGLNLGYLLVQIFSFLILFVVLRKWVFNPVIGLLEERREKIAQGLEDARVAEEARTNAEKEAEEILAKAQQEATRRLREATERAEETAREIRAEAEQAAAEIREAAHEDAQAEKADALRELRGDISSLAISAAQKVIGTSLDEARQRSLIDEFFSGIEAGRVVVLEGEALPGNSAEVTSAVPLTEEEQDQVQSSVLSQMGDAGTVSFRVDPDILGGLIIRVGDRVLDGSVAGKLEELRQRLV
jgi:F-type H+-transporting ATPase subunit b